MEKSIKKNDVIVIWDDEQINDMFSITNSVYKIMLPNLQVYYGSAELLADRIINHCTHINLKKGRNRLFSKALNKYKTIKVSLVGQYDTIGEARMAEKKIIKKASKLVYDKLGGKGNFSDVVHTTLLNSDLYVNCN